MEATRTWFRGHTSTVDVLLAVSVFALGVLSVRVFYDIGSGHPDFRFATGVACMALLTLPLAVRRRWPPVTLGCVTLAVLAYTIFGVTEGALTATVAFVAIYSVGAYCQPLIANWVRGLCIAVMFGDLLWVLFFRQIDFGTSKASVLGAGLLLVGSNVFFLLAAWVIGDVARTSRCRATELGVRNTELQAAHDVINEQAVLDERVRIARELHDVVAHHVSVMGVQAGAARRVLSRSPEQAAEVLSGIEASSRQAVAELQQLLGFLRSETVSGPGEALGAPQPSLSQLDALVAEMNDAGLVVTVEIGGTPHALPAGVDLSVYRVTQEALTNALKHSGVGTIVAVELTYASDHVDLSVIDDGRGRSNGRTESPLDDPTPSKGHGLIGMRERVALVGGTFHAQPRRGSGFEVSASFPFASTYRSAS